MPDNLFCWYCNLFKAYSKLLCKFIINFQYQFFHVRPSQMRNSWVSIFSQRYFLHSNPNASRQRSQNGNTIALYLPGGQILKSIVCKCIVKGLMEDATQNRTVCILKKMSTVINSNSLFLFAGFLLLPSVFRACCGRWCSPRGPRGFDGGRKLQQGRLCHFRNRQRRGGVLLQVP